ncbi:MAG: NAD(P)-dependent alcohol dehydrogenase [Luteimonas sp.]
MKITAAIARSKGAPLSLEAIDLEDPRADEVIVRVVATGICHTDIAMRDQTYPVPQPIVLGHEGAGVVERIGAQVTKVAAGDRVVMSFNFCGRCSPCAEHQPHYCDDYFARNFAGSRPDGTSPLSKDGTPIHGYFFAQSSFASHALCRERNIVKVGADAPLELLGPLACGVQTGAGAVIHSLCVGPGRSIVVFGAGSVGLSAVMAARLVGATTIIAVDVLDSRLELARSLGATHTVNPEAADIVEVVRSITRGGSNYCLETTGRPEIIRAAIDVLAARGTCGVVAAAPLGTEFRVDLAHIMTAGRRIVGIVEGDAIPDVFIPQLIELHRQGRFPFDRLVTFYPFDQINTAIDDAERGNVVKPILRMSDA